MSQNQRPREDFASRSLALVAGGVLTMLVLIGLTFMLEGAPVSSTGSPTAADGSLR